MKLVNIVLSKEDIKRFWSKVDIKSEDDCWEWRAATDGSGYGLLSIKHKMIKAHRIAWTIANGPIPKGKLILHKCDNRICVNLSHLYIGTQSDNNSDRAWRNPNNQGGPVSRFSLKDIEDMKNLVEKGKHKLFVANKYDISLKYVYTLITKEI